jgi:hypothetical protein
MGGRWWGGAVVAVGVWAGGCGQVALEGEEGWKGQERRALGGAEAAPIVLAPNVIQGRARFTNVNPEVVALLAAERRTGAVTATSSAPTGYVGRTEVRDAQGMGSLDFELTVEAGAGGEAGVLYTVAPQWDARYAFQPAREVRLRPRAVQPEPTQVELAECVGVVQVRFGQDASCTEPAEVKEVTFGGRAYGTPVGGVLHHYVHIPGGAAGPKVSETSTVVYRLGARADLDLRSFEDVRSWSVGCDEVVRLCVPVKGPDGVGALTGPWQVAGEQPRVERVVDAKFGPSGNYRTQKLTAGALESPVSDPERWWTLPNLPPGDYTLQGSGFVRQGRELTWFRTRALRPTAVRATETLASMDAAGRYPFDMHPAYFHGDIHLADPSLLTHPEAPSSLRALFFEADHDANHDGVADYPYFFLPVSRYGTSLRASAPGEAFSATSFPGRLEPGAAALRSSYEQVLPSPYDASASWTQETLRLGFWTQGASFYTRPGLYDPLTFRYGWLDLAQRQQRTAALGPGQRHRVDHAYCFNEVELELATPGKRFYNPTVAVKGGFQGTDWRGVPADYSAQGSFTGSPAVVGAPLGDAVQHAQERGTVRLALPQGGFRLEPGATMVNPEGGVTVANYQPLPLTLGCGQRIRVVPPLAINLEPRDTCASSRTVTVRGTVSSAPAEVDRVWYRLGEGPEVTVCTQCGANPTFSFEVQLGDCQNTVRVFATAWGMAVPAESAQQLLWDDPVDGQVCAGARCVHAPPVVRCRDVTVPGDATCGASTSVEDGSFDPDGGALTCTQTLSSVLGTGSHTVTLTCTDPEGQSASCQGTVTVVDALAPVLECPGPQVATCAGPEGAWVTPAQATATDSCSAVSVTGPAAGLYPPGTTPVTYSAQDAAGNVASCGTSIHVVPGGPLEARPLKLWSPNHEYYTVSLADCDITASGCGQPMDLSRAAITCVSSDEPADARGDGHTLEDIVIADATTVKLRGERGGQGDGRVYRIHFTVRDAAGRLVPGVCAVEVPHDRRGSLALAGASPYQVCRQ